jgi:two-component system, LytTR family, response regulator
MNQELKAILIDDERSAISNLTQLIGQFCPGVSIVATAENATEGIREIQEKKPDVVFLDIEMPGGTGFDLLACFAERNFDVVFVTSYNQHAIKAFKYSAVDYLLKPVDIDDLVQSVERIQQRRGTSGKTDNLSGLMQNLESGMPVKLGIATTEGKQYIDIQDIIRLEADGSYTTIYLKNEPKLVVSRNLGEYEQLLQDQPFFRIHHSHLVHLPFVAGYTKQEGGWITMNDGSQIPLARRRKELFEQMMRKISRE